MAVLEVETFSLAEGSEASTFRALDEAMQEWCYLNRTGLARRTTALADNNSYVVITLFDTASQSQPDYYTATDPVVRAWSAAINESSRNTTVYSLL